MKKLFFCAAALLAAISFAACSDDDETELPITSDNIVGTWKIVKGEEGEIYEGEADSWTENYPDEDGWYYTFTFNEDGSWNNIEYTHEKETRRTNGTYSISDNTLTMKDKYEYESFKREIKKLTDSELVFFDDDSDSESLWQATVTYKRIK